MHKSLKYEIWSSTDPGNKRLDKAFKETNGRGPIYLFFSVNARSVLVLALPLLCETEQSRQWSLLRDGRNANTGEYRALQHPMASLR